MSWKPFESAHKYAKRLLERPDALARIRGGPGHAQIRGTVSFYRTGRGVLVAAQVFGLPRPADPCANRVFGFHIHEGRVCAGTADDPFADALGHYNPGGCPHPQHAGDLPPLFSNDGYAFLAVVTDRFTIEQVLGRAVIVHDNRDDFTTQPGGDSGGRIACGIIEAAEAKGK